MAELVEGSTCGGCLHHGGRRSAEFLQVLLSEIRQHGLHVLLTARIPVACVRQRFAGVSRITVTPPVPMRTALTMLL